MAGFRGCAHVPTRCRPQRPGASGVWSGPVLEPAKKCARQECEATATDANGSRQTGPRALRRPASPSPALFLSHGRTACAIDSCKRGREAKRCDRRGPLTPFVVIPNPAGFWTGVRDLLFPFSLLLLSRLAALRAWLVAYAGARTNPRQGRPTSDCASGSAKLSFRAATL